MKIETIKFDINSDGRGNLISLENNKNIPFDIKRVYYIYDTNKDIIRGKHAHKNLKQVAICVSGSCDFILDNGKERKSIKLNSPDKGLVINDLIWREMANFSKDCVLMVLASELYDESDYIRDYECFLEEVNNDSSDSRRSI